MLIRLAIRAAIKLKKDESGATAIEYALIVGAVALVIIGSLSFFGGGFDTFADKLSCALTGTAQSDEGSCD